MIYPTPIIIPASRGHSVSIDSVPLSAKLTISGLMIALILIGGFTWWEMINDFDSKLEQIIITLVFFLIETSLICLLIGIF